MTTKTLGEQAAEKLVDENYYITTDRKKVAAIINTLHAQQPCGCEKLREALEEIKKVTPQEGGYAKIGEIIDGALAQPCRQPASVGSEEWTKANCALVGHTPMCDIAIGPNVVALGLAEPEADLLIQRHNTALRRQAAEIERLRKLALEARTKLAERDFPEKFKEITGAQSAPVEAWRDLESDEIVQNGDRYYNPDDKEFEMFFGEQQWTASNPKWTSPNSWQRRVTQGEQK